MSLSKKAKEVLTVALANASVSKELSSEIDSIPAVAAAAASAAVAAGANVQVLRYEYDFAVDGGAIGVIDLWNKAGYGIIPAGTYVLSIYRAVLTPFDSGGAATVSFGFEADPTAFMNAVGYAGINNGSNQYDFVAESSGWPIGYSKPVFTIAGAPLTAGKMSFLFLAIPANVVSG